MDDNIFHPGDNVKVGHSAGVVLAAMSTTTSGNTTTTYLVETDHCQMYADSADCERL